MKKKHLQIVLKLAFTAILFFLNPEDAKSQCSSTTPSFNVNLSSAVNATFTSPSFVRDGTCCANQIAGECLLFVITLHPNAMGINFGIASGSQPPGALFYQINCDTTVYTIGTPVCLNGIGPHYLTFCKPGGNTNTYTVSSLPKPQLPDSIMVRSGCTQTLSVQGFSVPTIKWNAVNSSSTVSNYSLAYNGYLSCVSGCSLTVVSPTAFPPAWIDYEVSGYGAAPCITDFYRDTVRVFFFTDLLAAVNTATICAGQVNAVLTLTASGGKAPLSYTWSTGSNAGSIIVGPGNYSVIVQDATGCPPVTASTSVLNFTLPITVAANPDFTVCRANPAIALNRTITAASGASWTSTGTGSFAPTATANPVTYNPSSADLAAGFVQFYVTTTGNQGCQPDQDTVIVSFQNSPTITVAPSAIICANNATTSLSANITGFTSATPVWVAATGNTLSAPGALTTLFSAGSGAITSGSVAINLSTTNNGVCPPATASTVIFITPSPSVNAGSDIFMCSNSVANLNGLVTLGATTGSWTSSGNGVFSSVNSLTTSYTPGSADISAGSATLVLKSTANGLCLQVNDTVRLIIAPLTTVNVTPPPVICSNATFISLTGTVTGATNTGSWSTSGGGNFTPNSAGAAQYNLVQNDRSLTQLVFTLSSTNNTVCPQTVNTVTVPIVPLATVTAGSNTVVCSTDNTIALSGTANSGSWTSSGSGTFNNSSNPVSLYAFSANDILNGVVMFTLTSTNNSVCPAVSDSVAMRIRPVAVPNAGLNQFICSNAAAITLSGSVAGGTNTGSWAASGAGAFGSVNNLNTTYNVTQNDITAGQVIFTLTSSPNTPCASVADTVLVKLFQAPVSSAGTGSPICSTNNPFPLFGSISGGAGTGSWTAGGTGTFPTGTNSLQTTYFMTAADINSGVIVFTLSSTNNGPCGSSTSTLAVTVLKQATVTTAPNQTLCSNNPMIPITGTISGGTGTMLWHTTGTGTFSPGSSFLTGNYIASPTEITNGNVSLILTSTNNTPCVSSSDTIFVKFFQEPVSVAGSGSIICSTDNPFPLAGSISGGTGTGSWTAGGSGTFPAGNNSLQTTYLMTAADINSGVIVFTLSSTNNGPCGSATSTLAVTIQKQATVTAAPNQSLCANNLIIPVTGTVNGGTGSVMWLTNGTGSFTPGPSFMTGNYQASSADIVKGSVLLTLTSTNDAPCVQHSDSMRVYISIPAQVIAGNYTPVCSNAGTISLNGAISGGSQNIAWISSGSGTFVPNANTPNAGYRFSQADVTNGTVTVTINSINNGVCPAASHAATLAIRAQPSVTAVSDQSICSTQQAVNLTATLSGVSQTAIWITNGTGTFTPNDVAINTSYNVSPSDINVGKLFFVLVTTSNDVCPAAKDSANLIITKFPVITMQGDTTICSNERRMTVNPQILNGNGNYQWTTTGSGSFDPDLFTIPATYLLSEQDANTSGVVLTLNTLNNGACGKISSNYSINIKPSPKADFEASTYVVSLPGEPVIFTNTTKDGGSYRWDFGDGTFTTVPSPVKNFTEVGFFQIVLSAKNQHNCTDTVRKQITVIKEALVPTAFTPNGDNLNSTFRIVTDGVTDYDLMIFNRWGEMIFRSTDLKYGWDGTFNGKPCQQDAYVWKAKIKFFDGRTFDKVGSITLLR